MIVYIEYKINWDEKIYDIVQIKITKILHKFMNLQKSI